MGTVDLLKLVVGIPAGPKILAKHGTVPVPGETQVELPAGKVTCAESVRPKSDEDEILFSAPGELEVAGTPLIEVPAAGPYMVSAGPELPDAVEPRILLG